jgi:putative membrane-bound dehydrogenase-like protein
MTSLLAKRLLALLGVCYLSVSLVAQDVGTLPVKDGKPLNFDFEMGDLRDWRTEGEAFQQQPIKGDTVVVRRSDNRSRNQGQYWIGGFEKLGDKPRGKLISVPFTVTHPYASFLVGGGNHLDTCVELVDEKRNEVIFRASGMEEEDLRRVVVDLQKHQGKSIFIQLVDNQTGHWGHVNFDDFRFHASKPDFPARPSTQLTADNYKYAGLPPEESAKVMTVPEGFSVSLFAGEPDVKQPIAFCQDDRGRLWIAEAYGYPRRQPEGKGKDRILILEDTNHDGKFDKRTVFMEGLNLVSGIELGYGGVWVGAAPYLLFIPIDASGDKPAGEPKILLDGWGYQDTHETLNTFNWGPDGWLYGCHGVFTHSKVGKPGTADDKRIKINAGIWRYHPTKHRFEVFAEGTSNPWGLDYNKDGQFFIEACVIPHCFHIIQGARYLRQAGQHFNPYTFADIGTIADHFHYLGATPHGGNNKSDSAGGGHAHCGLMVYEGATWPKEYHGQLFMGNIHGRRINVDRLTRKGSGFVASHGPDFLLANDAWARFINMQYGPDGNVYLIDWYDQQACHRNEPEIWDRSNGRVYKITHRSTAGKQTDLQKLGGDLSKLDVKQLQELLKHDNQWYVRHARRILAERQMTTARDYLPSIQHKLVMKPSEGRWPVMLQVNSEYERAWELQLALEDKKSDEALLDHMQQLAKNDSSPVVRLYIASALQRLSPGKRWSILEELLTHEEDKDDHNLPLMYWYAAEPLAELDPGKALRLAMNSKVPMLEFMVRRIAAMDKPHALEQLVTTLGVTSDVTRQKLILSGITRSLKGRRNVAPPANWPTIQNILLNNADAALVQETLQLGVIFADERSIQELIRQVGEGAFTAQQRSASLQSLLGSRHPAVGKLLLQLLNDRNLRIAAIRGLATFDQKETPAALIAAYAKLNSTERRDAVSTLASRSNWAKELLTAVDTKKVPLADVPADVVRQLRQYNDAGLNEQIAAVWGVVRNTPADRLKTIAASKKMIGTKATPEPDLHLGRALYQKTCAQCHQLFGTGGKVGPDITGSNRANLDYLLENIYDPNAVIPKEYAATFFITKDGRSITGIVKERNAKTVTIATATETLTLPVDDIEGEKPSEVSMMPEDQMKPFSDFEVRSLFAYLQSPAQVPMQATQDNAASFFNGKDLTGWVGDAKLWKVENGEIVGTSPGIKKNEFLKSEMSVGDFRLSLKVRLKPNKENSGIQFRSEAQAGGDVKGYQADAGQGWWGKLYEEHGRALLTKNDGDQFVKKDDWNDYVIEAKGSKIKTWINGNLCVDIDDPKGATKGIVAFQIHSGGPMEVRFKEVKLEVLK